MSHVAAAIRTQFESMPVDLKNAVLGLDVDLNNMNDLMHALERIIQEGETHA